MTMARWQSRVVPVIEDGLAKVLGILVAALGDALLGQVARGVVQAR